MNRNWLNLLVDVVTALAALGLVFTGLLIYFVMPPGSGRGRLTLLGADRHVWGDVHFWIAIAVLALVIVHVTLHWQWLCTMVCRMSVTKSKGAPAKARRNLAGLAAATAVVGLMGGALLLARASLVVNASTDQHHAEGTGRIDADPASNGTHIVEARGSMTFAEAAEAAGIDARDLIAAVGLPPDTDPQARIGRTVRATGLDMTDVRAAMDVLLTGR